MLTHLPLTWTSQVPHSPFLHLYLMNWSAWDATSDRGVPTSALVIFVALPCLKRTWMAPARPESLIVLGSSASFVRSVCHFRCSVLARSKVGWRGRERLEKARGAC